MRCCRVCCLARETLVAFLVRIFHLCCKEKADWRIDDKILEIGKAALQRSEEQAEESEEETAAPSAATGGAPLAGSASSFRFIQESELEPSAFEEDAHVIDKAELAEYVPETNGHASHDEEEQVSTPALATPSGPIDWAEDDEGQLPDISEFKASGSATPEPSAAIASVAPTQPGQQDDGFQQARSRGRGRGGPHGHHHHGHRGFDGERGGRGRGRGMRGGFRGGERGPGGERGERGPGGERGERGPGGERGERGERRGPRPDRPQGERREWHGEGGERREWHGERREHHGERRGRGGRGRGGFGGPSGGPAPAPAPAPAAPAA